MLERGDAYLFLETPERDRYVLHAKLVTALRVEDFLVGNIVFDVQSLEGNEITIRDVIRVEKSLDQTQAEATLKRWRKERMVMMRVNPAHGGGAVVVAGSFELVSLSKGGNTPRNV